MAKLIALTEAAFRNVAAATRKVLRTLPPVPKRTRRIYNGNGNGGGGDGDGSCQCCKCTNCISDAEAVVTQCDECPDGAAMAYRTNFGESDAFPALFGEQEVLYSDDCTWLGPVIEVTDPGYSTGAYQWVKTMAGAGTGWELVFISGVDVVYQGIYSNYRYVALNGYNCRCESKLQAVDPHKWPSRDYLNCQICDVPKFENICEYCKDFCFCLTLPEITVLRWNGGVPSGSTVFYGDTFRVSYFDYNPTTKVCRWMGGNSILVTAQMTVGPSGEILLQTIQTRKSGSTINTSLSMMFNVYTTCDSGSLVAVFRDNFGFSSPGYTIAFDPPLEDLVFNLTKLTGPQCSISPSPICS